MLRRSCIGAGQLPFCTRRASEPEALVPAEQPAQVRFITQISTLRYSFVSCGLDCIIQVIYNNTAPDAIVGGNLGVQIVPSGTELGRVRHFK